MKIMWITMSVLAMATAWADTPMQMSPAETKYMQDMDVQMKKMDRDMATPMTGDVDRDFATMMIPHHQGAVEMAKAELNYGKDPEMRHLAEQIISDQKREIALMNRWLSKQADEKKDK